MLDRQKVEAILTRRFPGARRDAVAAAANALMGLTDEWEEVLHDEAHVGSHDSPHCGPACSLAPHAPEGVEFRLFRRREPPGAATR
jgi:hypothetical protein